MPPGLRRFQVNKEVRSMEKTSKQKPEKTETVKVKPGWVRFMKYCEQLGYGELTKVSIQNGLPMSAEYVKKKIRFN